jgi:NAD(P)H dehydrogenase (quinone)
MDLIIYSHPDNEKSHNAAVLRRVIQRLKSRSADYKIIDLYDDEFDAILRIKPEDEGKKKLVDKYRRLVDSAERLIFIFPVWWFNLPAILKGFIDIVFSPGFAHDFNPKGGELRQRLKGKKAVVINTFGRSEELYKNHGNEPSIVFDEVVLRFCGIEEVTRINWFDVKLPCLLTADITRKIDEVI